MRVGMFLNYAGGFREVADEVAELEAAGVDLVAVPEAYSFDAVSQLGFLAARTSRMTLMSGILQLYTRTPTLTAMTAAGLFDPDDGAAYVVLDGEFRPGLLVGITVEPAVGSAAPTSDPIVAIET